MKKIEEKEYQAPKKVWYKSAILPWAIIIFVAVLFTGVVIGWTLRSKDVSRVNYEASSLISQLK